MKKIINIKLGEYKVLLMASVLLVSMSISMAQKTNLSVRISNRCSSSGLGSFIVPELSIRKKKSELIFGTNIQKNHMNVSGFKTGYNYTAYSGKDCELFLFTDVDYFNKAYLCKSLVKLESAYHSEYGSYYRDLRLNVIEQHAGFGIRFFNSKFFNCYAAIGAGGFYTLNLKPKELFRFREQSGSSLLIKFGFRVNIINSAK